MLRFVLSSPLACVVSVGSLFFRVWLPPFSCFACACACALALCGLSLLAPPLFSATATPTGPSIAARDDSPVGALDVFCSVSFVAGSFGLGVPACGPHVSVRYGTSTRACCSRLFTSRLPLWRVLVCFYSALTWHSLRPTTVYPSQV